MEDELNLSAWEELDFSKIDPFGGCPHCQLSDGYRNIGPSHWGFCEVHKTTWKIGENLFSSWQHETEEQWAENEAFLAEYEVYEDPPPPEALLYDDDFDPDNPGPPPF